MGNPTNRGYKRSWKNYLLNARYQLRFTLFMVGLSALLMCGLGYWVLSAADKATRIALDNVRGTPCDQQEVSLAAEGGGDQPAPVVVVDDQLAPATVAAPVPPKEVGGEVEANELPAAEEPGQESADDALPEPSPEHSTGAAAPTEELASAEGTPLPERTRGPVKLDVQTAPVMQVVEPSVVRYHLCQLKKNTTIERLHAGKRRITWVMVLAGLLVCLGLAIKGILMTHKVAGPLHKVSLYFAKMERGRFDTVYKLRKGDQLVAFYDHFKEAHTGLKAAEDQDYQRLRELIADLRTAGAAERTPEIAAAITVLEQRIADKEAADE